MSNLEMVTTYGDEEKSAVGSNFIGILRGFRNGYGLGKQLAIRDIRAMYRQSALGILWAVFTPIAQTLVWVFLSEADVLNVGETEAAYPIFVLSGIMLWTTFLGMVNAPLAMFNSSRSILSKININKESLIIAGFIKELFNLAIRFVVLIPLFFYFNVGWSQYMLLAPLLIIGTLIFGLTIGVLITPIGVLYKDVQRFIITFSQLFFFLSPFIRPAQTEGWFGLWDRYNPVSVLICSARDTLLGIPYQDWAVYGVYMAVVLVFMVLSMLLYRSSLPIIVERMGS
jgi:lipopolysaccharide transport system permease protein